MNLFLALGGERCTCFHLAAPECNSVQLQCSFGLSTEGLLATFLLNFQSGITENYRSFVTKCDRNRPGPSAGSVDIRLQSTGPQWVKLWAIVIIPDFNFCCWVSFLLGLGLLLVIMLGSLPWGQVKAASCSGSSSGVSLSRDSGFCLLPILADSVEWIFDSLLLGASLSLKAI